ncbi:MAG: ORF6N domain-containing protein [Actinomycetota bacterium]|nr:ORF6N domain-containing protein [Actinomycetota bacterium]
MSVYQRECTGYVHTTQETHKKSKRLCILSNTGTKGEAGMSGSDRIKHEEIMFQITDDEFNRLRSQIVTSNQSGGRRHLPYDFTEQGIAMLSAVLRSETAIKVSNRFAIIDNTTVYHFGAVEMLTRLKEMKA